MKQFSYTVKDPEGLHARPASILAKETVKYQSTITLLCGERRVSAKKLFSIMSLAVKCGMTVTLEVDGPDEEEAYEKLLCFFQENL